MKKIWEKKKSIAQNSLVNSYCFLEGVAFDNHLILYDILGSIAHIYMLEDMGIFTKSELKQVINGFKDIIDLSNKGLFVVSKEDEDVHTKIEAHLTKKLGTVAEKIHTARSRNDQVAVDMRLYAKDKTCKLASETIKSAQSLISFAKKYEYVPMPGYTHMQKAMPSSVGMWIMSFVESLIDDLHLVKGFYEVNDQSPLGSGAAFGISLPINREVTAKYLGFSSVLNNSLYCQAARPKVQLALMQACVQIMLTASKFATDVLLFTTSEFHFFTVGDSISTGSSIMPQKKNLDVMEYVRAKTHTVLANHQMVAGICSSLPSGYNADFGQTKKPFMETVEIAHQTMQIVQMVLEQLKPNCEVLEAACTKELYAAHSAYLQVQKGVSFRTAYKTVGDNLQSIPHYDPLDVIKATNHTGGPGNLGINNKQIKLNEIKKWWKNEGDNFIKIVSSLIK